MVEVCQFLNLTKNEQVVDSYFKNVDVPKFSIYNESFVKIILNTALERYKIVYAKKLHPCPLDRNHLKDFNTSSSYKFDFETLMPDGDYKYEHTNWNDEDDNIFQKTVYEKFRTGEESFF